MQGLMLSTGLHYAKRSYDHRVETAPPSETPRPQQGFEHTALATGSAVRTERWQTGVAASGMGYLPWADNEFLERNGDINHLADHNRPVGTFPIWNPLWQDRGLNERRRRQEYDWKTLTPHSEVERVLLHSNQSTRAAPGNPHMLDFTRPPKHDHMLSRANRIVLK